MTQSARPIQDIAVGGWGPRPLYSQLNEFVPDDTTLVASAANPDSFEVKLAALSWPLRASQTVNLRLRQTQAGSLAVTVMLVQGSGVIAFRQLTLTQSFDPTFVMTLSQAEIDRITDYTNVRVRVVVGRVLTTACSQVPSAAYYFQFTPSGIGNVSCRRCTDLNNATVLSWVTACTWASSLISYCPTASVVALAEMPVTLAA